MKKILALILMVSCLFSVVSCFGFSTAPSPEVTTINEIYARSNPTKSVITTCHAYGDNEYLGKYELTTGMYNGKKATIYQYTYQELPAISDYSDVVKKSVQGSMEYVEGWGVRTNVVSDEYASFKMSGKDFAPEKGAIALNLSASNLSDIKYENHVFTAKVSAENAPTVFGSVTDEEGNETPLISQDATITIVDEGAFITSITITYTVPSSIEGAPNIDVTIKAEYSYLPEVVEPLA